MARGREQNQDDKHQDQSIHDFSTSSNEMSVARPSEPQVARDREEYQDQEDDDKRIHVGDLPGDEPFNYTHSWLAVNLASARSHTVRPSTV